MSHFDVPVERIEGPGIIPHVRANGGTAWVSVYLVSGRLESHAFSVDELFLLPELYIAAFIERLKWARESLGGGGTGNDLPYDD